MSDETPETPENAEAPGAEPTAGAEQPRRNPGAAAASRARRIGGRPAAARPTPAPVPLTKPDAAQPADSAAEEPAADAARERPAAPTDPEGVAMAPPVIPAWLNWAPAGVLGAGCVVLAVLLVVFSHGVWWGPDPAARPDAAAVAAKRQQVLAAAKTCVVAANDYDYRQLDSYEKRALACTTGKLTAQLKRTIDSLIRKNAPQIKARQATQINRGGIEAVTPDGKQWTLLIFGQLSVVNSNYPKGRTDPFGAQVRMEKAHGTWVMSSLTVVSSPAQSG